MKYYISLNEYSGNSMREGDVLKAFYSVGQDVNPSWMFCPNDVIWEVEPLELSKITDDIICDEICSLDDGSEPFQYKCFISKHIKLIKKLSIEEINENIKNLKLDASGNVLFEITKSVISSNGRIYTRIRKGRYDKNNYPLYQYTKCSNSTGESTIVEDKEYEYDSEGRSVYIKDNVSKNVERRYFNDYTSLENMTEKQKQFIIDNYERIKRDKEKV
jgi:hypothetical protein